MKNTKSSLQIKVIKQGTTDTANRTIQYVNGGASEAILYQLGRGFASLSNDSFQAVLLVTTSELENATTEGGDSSE